MKYGCGHDPEPIFLEDNPLSYAAYCEWKFDVDNGMSERCFGCWCKR